MSTPELTRSQLFRRLNLHRQEQAELREQLDAGRDEVLDLIDRGKAIADVKEMTEAAGLDRRYYYQLVKKREAK